MFMRYLGGGVGHSTIPRSSHDTSGREECVDMPFEVEGILDGDPWMPEAGMDDLGAPQTETTAVQADQERGPNAPENDNMDVDEGIEGFAYEDEYDDDDEGEGDGDEDEYDDEDEEFCVGPDLGAACF